MTKKQKRCKRINFVLTSEELNSKRDKIPAYQDQFLPDRGKFERLKCKTDRHQQPLEAPTPLVTASLMNDGTTRERVITN